MVERKDGDLNRVTEIETQAEQILKQEPWRKAGPEERVEFINWLSLSYGIRQAHGQEKYGAVFQGNPIEQGIEENLDQLFYLYWSQRQLSFVEGQRNTYRHLLEAVMEFGLTEAIASDISQELGIS